MQLFQHEGVRRYASNTLWLLAENVIRLITGVLIGVWVTRFLGPEKYGIISYAIAFVAIFSSIAKVGLDSIIVRELVNHEEKKAELLGTAFWLKMIGGIITFTLIAIISYLTPHNGVNNLYILIISAGVLLQSFEVIDFYYQSQVKSKYVSICKIIQTLLSSVVKLYLIFIQADLVYFALTYLLDYVFLSILLYLTYMLQKHENFYKKFNFEIAKQLILESWPVIIVGIAITVQGKLDQVILGKMMGSIPLGYYALAIGLIEIISFIPMILNSSIAPAIINAKKRSSEEYGMRMQNYYSLMFILSVLVGLPLYFFGQKITILLYGNEFSPAGVLLSLMALRIFFANMGVARSQYILNEKLFKYNLINTILGAIVSIVLNIYLVPIYGPLGAIYASYCSFFASTFALDLIYKGTRSNILNMMKGILKFYSIFTYMKVYKPV